VALVSELFLLSGCTTVSPKPKMVEAPVSHADQQAAQGATKGTELLVDGLSMGEARKFNGHPKSLRLEPGWHRVEVRSRRGAVMSQDIFLGVAGADLTHLE